MAEKAGSSGGNATGEVGADHLRAFGRIMVNFGNLELWLALAIWSLLETDGPTSQTVTAELSFRARLNLLSSLGRAKLIGDAALAADVAQFIRDADTCEQARNQIVHSHWLVAPNGRLSRVKFTAKSKGLQTQSEEMPVERIDAIADDIRAAIERFQPTMGALVTRIPWIERTDGPPTDAPISGTLI